MICDCSICKRQHAEERCLERIGNFFGWILDRVPFEGVFDYEAVMHERWEYIALTHFRSHVKYWSSKYGYGSCEYFDFKTFLKWLSIVEYFISPDIDISSYESITLSVRNPFFGRPMTTVEEVTVVLDLKETV